VVSFTALPHEFACLQPRCLKCRCGCLPPQEREAFGNGRATWTSWKRLSTAVQLSTQRLPPSAGLPTSNLSLYCRGVAETVVAHNPDVCVVTSNPAYLSFVDGLLPGTPRTAAATPGQAGASEQLGAASAASPLTTATVVEAPNPLTGPADGLASSAVELLDLEWDGAAALRGEPMPGPMRSQPPSAAPSPLSSDGSESSPGVGDGQPVAVHVAGAVAATGRQQARPTSAMTTDALAVLAKAVLGSDTEHGHSD
jgi:hypothetical protein